MDTDLKKMTKRHFLPEGFPETKKVRILLKGQFEMVWVKSVGVA